MLIFSPTCLGSFSLYLNLQGAESLWHSLKCQFQALSLEIMIQWNYSELQESRFSTDTPGVLTLRNTLCNFRGWDSDESNILQTFEMLMYLWLRIQVFYLQTTICFKPKQSLPCISWTLGFYQKCELFQPDWWETHLIPQDD